MLLTMQFCDFNLYLDIREEIVGIKAFLFLLQFNN